VAALEFLAATLGVVGYPVPKNPWVVQAGEINEALGRWVMGGEPDVCAAIQELTDEVPMVQWTVEELWDRLHMNEGSHSLP
jgi:hypothetical protein